MNATRIFKLLVTTSGLLAASATLAGPIGNTVLVPQDEPDLQTAVNQVQGLSAATMIVDDTASYKGPIVISDSVLVTAASGASPTVFASGAQSAIRIDLPSVMFRPEVDIAISGLNLLAPGSSPGTGQALLDVDHDTSLTDLTLTVDDMGFFAEAGLSRPCLSVIGAPGAAAVDVRAENIECRTTAQDGNNVFAVQFESPSGGLRILGDSRIEVTSLDTASTAIAVDVNNLDSGQTVSAVLQDLHVEVRGIWATAFGILTNSFGSIVSVVDSTFVFDASNIPLTPRGGGAPLIAYAVWAESGSLVDAGGTRFLNESSIETDMQLLATDVTGAASPAELRLRNCLVDHGRVRLVAANAGGPQTATDGVLVNNTIHSPTRTAVTLQTTTPDIGSLELIAYSNALISATGIELFGPVTGLSGQWDHNLYDVLGSTTVGIAPGPDAVIGDAQVVNALGGLFAPRRGSPLIDAGDTAIANLYAPAQDLAGNDRYSGPEVDIGAYELRQGPIFSDRFE